MKVEQPQAVPAVEVSIAGIIDGLCDRFETAWNSYKSPRIEEVLSLIDEPLRPQAVRELLLIELEIRRDKGEDPATAEYHARLPTFTREIEAVFVQSPGPADKETCKRDAARNEGLKVRCPDCQARMVVNANVSLDDLNCPACDSKFSLINDSGEATSGAPVQSIGHFQLLKQLGAGGFGTVWQAYDTRLDRPVALKIPRKGQLAAAEIDMFFREARAAAQLRHSNIVSVHEVGRHDSSIYIISDLIEGLSLDRWLQEQKLTAREAADMCITIACALDHAHEAGVVHRDLKPQNVLIDLAGHPHLTDFGLAKRDVGEITMTLDGQVLGTPAYMSPEQATGDAHNADRRTDVYSLGVILFQLLTGEVPFRGNARMLMHQVIHDEPPSPRKLNSNVPRDLETITLKCLEKQPYKRYQRAQEVAEELRRFLTGMPIHARPVTPPERAWRWAKRYPAIATLSTTIAVISIAAFAIVATQLIQRIEAQKRWVNSQVDALSTASEQSIPFFIGSLNEFQGYSTDRLKELYFDSKLTDSQRIRVALPLLRTDGALVDDLAKLSLDATPGEIRVICDEYVRLKLYTTLYAEALQQPPLSAQATASDHDVAAKRKANAAIALARLGQLDRVWPLLRSSDDNSVRSQIIDRWAPSGASADALGDRFCDSVTKDDERRALVLALGGFRRTAFSRQDLEKLIVRLDLLKRFENEPDAGLHGALRWLLCRWGKSADVGQIESRLAEAAGPRDGANWYVGAELHTMAVFGPVEFELGSPPSEAERDARAEQRHPCNILHSFSIAQQEVTIAQFQRFKKLVGPLPGPDNMDPDCPARFIPWSDAAGYCNWLSDKAGIPHDQWCYIVNPHAPGAFLPATDYLDRIGYRLPTEAEWEYTCRAGTQTPRFFGYSLDLLPQYAQCLRRDPSGRKGPVAKLLPNDFGLFDVYGNATEWCNDCFAPFDARPTIDEGGPATSLQDPGSMIVVRGTAAGDVVLPRSALRDRGLYTRTSPAIGFRIARTEHASQIERLNGSKSYRSDVLSRVE